MGAPYYDEKSPEELAAAQEEKRRLAHETEVIALRQLNQPESLREMYRRLTMKYDFKLGQVVDWNPGLRNRSLFGPFIIVEILQIPVRLTGHDGATADSSNFMETVDVRVLMRSSENGAFTFMLDSSRLQPAD